MSDMSLHHFRHLAHLKTRLESVSVHKLALLNAWIFSASQNTIRDDEPIIAGGNVEASVSVWKSDQLSVLKDGHEFVFLS